MHKLEHRPDAYNIDFVPVGMERIISKLKLGLNRVQATMPSRFFRILWCEPQGRSSVAEQRPFKPLVVGSTPTAPTSFLLQLTGLPNSAGQQKAALRNETSAVVHQNHPRTEKAVVPSAWSANFRRDLLIDPGKIELIS